MGEGMCAIYCGECSEDTVSTPIREGTEGSLIRLCYVQSAPSAGTGKSSREMQRKREWRYKFKIRTEREEVGWEETGR